LGAYTSRERKRGYSMHHVNAVTTKTSDYCDGDEISSAGSSGAQTKNKKRMRTPESSLKLLKRIRKNRTKRMVSSDEYLNGTEPQSSTGFEDTNQVCFLCGELLFGDTEDINRHIDECLAAEDQQRINNRSSSGDAPSNLTHSNGYEEQQYDSFAVYTIAGHTRIRATSLVERSPPRKKMSEDEDEDIDLDIDSDGTERYGQSQYDASSLIRPVDDDADEFSDESNANDNHTDQNSPYNEDAAFNGSSIVNNNWISDGKEFDEDDVEVDIDDTNCNRNDTTGGSNFLLIESLKSKIREMVKLSIIWCWLLLRLLRLFCYDLVGTQGIKVDWRS
jgi:hypothetical protein